MMKHLYTLILCLPLFFTTFTNTSAQCSIDNLMAVANNECNDNGKYNIDINFTITGGDNNGFDVYINDVFFSYYDDYPTPTANVTLEDVAIANGEPLAILVKDNDNPNCSAEFEIINTPRCEITCNNDYHFINLGYPGSQYQWEIEIGPNTGTLGDIVNGQVLNYLPDPTFEGLEQIVVKRQAIGGTEMTLHYINLIVTNCQANECEITNVWTETDCNNDGTYGLNFGFEVSSGVGDLVDIWVNDEYEGAYSLGLSNYPLQGISPRYTTPYDLLKICIQDHPDCCIEMEYLAPECNTPQCEIQNFFVETYCDNPSNGTYNAQIIYHVANADSDSVLVWVNNELHDYYPLNNGDIVVENITPQSTGTVDVVQICSVENPNCCAFMEFVAPTCNVPNCEIQNLTVDPSCLDNGNYSAFINYEILNNNSNNAGVDIWVNNVFYENFPQGTTQTIVENISAPSSNQYDIIQVCLTDNPNCCAIFEYLTPDCGSGNQECEIIDLVVDPFCNDDGTYNTRVIFDVLNANNNLVDVWVNNELYDSYPIGSTPLLENIVPRLSTSYDIVKVCLNDNLTCCTEIEYLAPDCVDTLECEIVDMWVEPFCGDNGNYNAYVGFEVLNGDNDFVELWLNDQFYSSYPIDSLIIINNITPLGTTPFEAIRVCMNGNTVCCTEIAYDIPVCLDTVGCEIIDLVVDPFCNDDGTYNTRVIFDVLNANNNLVDVWVNNELYDSYPIGSTPLLENIVPRLSTSYDIIKVCLNDDLTCCTEIEYLTPTCVDSTICEIEGLWVDHVCLDNGNYDAYIGFNGLNSDTDTVDVWVDNVLYENIPTINNGNGTQTIVEDITSLSTNSYVIFQVCLDNEPNCCAVLEYQRPTCNTQCEIVDLWVEHICNDNGTYDAMIGYEVLNVNVGTVEVLVNGEPFGVHPIGTQTLLENITSLPTNPFDIIEVCLTDYPNCCAVIEYQTPNCVDDTACEIQGLWSEQVCLDNGNYDAHIWFDVSTVTNDTVDIWVDGVLFENYPTIDVGGEQYTIIENVTPILNTSNYSTIQVCLDDNPNCCIVLDYLTPDCAVDTMDCSIVDLWIEPYCVDNGLYNAQIGFEVLNGNSNTVDVKVNGDLQGTYPLGTQTLLENLTSVSSTIYNVIEVCLTDNPNCCVALDYLVPDCVDTNDCEVVDLWVQHGNCDEDGTYDAYIGFGVLNGNNNLVDIWVNNELFASQIVDSVTILENITPRSTTPYDVIKVCINDSPDCCTEIEYLTPDCVVDTVECEILDLWVEPYCADDGMYNAYIGFEVLNGNSNMVDVWVNNELYDTYPINSQPLLENLTSISPTPFDIIKVCLDDNPNCCTEIEYLVPICVDTVACEIVDMWVDTDCGDDGAYNAYVGFEVLNGDNDFVDVWVNNQLYTSYPVDSLITIYNIIPQGATPFDVIKVCMNGNTVCCTEIEYLVPDCQVDTADCEITDLWVEAFCRDDGTYNAYIGYEVLNGTNSQVDVWVNNQPYATYPADSLSILYNLTSQGNSPNDIIKVCMTDNPNCCAEVEYLAPICEDTLSCEIVNLWLQVGECNTDGTYNAYVGYEVLNGNSNTVDIWVNNELFDTYPIDSETLLENITPRGTTTHDIVKICVTDNPDCCVEWEYLAPECEAMSMQCTGFDELEMGAAYTNQNTAEGDNMFTINEISASLESFTYTDGTTDMQGVWVQEGNEGSIQGHTLWIGNSTILFDFNNVADTVQRVTFDYWDGGGEENISVNGMPVMVVNSLLELPTNIAPGVTLTKNFLPPLSGQIVLEGEIFSLQIGGQEFMLDNLCYLGYEIETTGPSTNTEEVELANHLKVFPNPATDVLNIESYQNKPIQKIRIFDLLGQLVYEKAQPENQIQLDNFQSGLYIMQVEYEEGKVAKKIEIIK